MKIVLNGEDRVIKSLSVEALLVELNLSNKKLAIEHNKKILPRDMYGSTSLTEGDNIEIVHFIGGG
jgi:thiamine biosynthesis protein ThiS